MRVLLIIVLISITLASVDLTGFHVIKDFSNPILDIPRGEKFAFELVSNPTTGFDWYIVNADELTKESCLIFFRSKADNLGYYEPKKKPVEMVGVGGKTFFKFQNANSIEETKTILIKLVYKRPWEETFISSLNLSVKLL